MVLESLYKKFSGAPPAVRQNFVLAPHPGGVHRMAYREWGHSDNPRVLLAVHGLTGNGHDFDRLAKYLQKDFRVICVDMVGRGASDWLPEVVVNDMVQLSPPSGSALRYLRWRWLQLQNNLYRTVNSHVPAYNYWQYMSDLWVLLARIQPPQLFWLGTSMGGILGMMLAAEKKQPFAGMVLNDVGAYITYTALEIIASNGSRDTDWADRTDAQEALRDRYKTFGIVREEHWQELFEHYLRQGDDGRWHVTFDPQIYRSVYNAGADIDLWSYYDAIECPTLLIRGAESRFLDRDVCEQMAKRGPRAQLVEFAAAGHAPALREEAHIKTVADFFSGTVGGG